MKKYLFVFLKSILFIVIAFLIVFKSVSIYVERKIIKQYPNRSMPEMSLNDTAIIHFIHGSIPMKNCIYSRKRLGGLLGGHVEIELSGRVYGFRLRQLPVHVFVNNDDFNSKYEVNPKEKWLKRTEYEKMTSIYLCINAAQKDKLQAILDTYLDKVPYDYAFFGKRCAASTVEVLSQAGIIAPLSDFENELAFLSPRPLRNTLLTLADKKGLLVVKKVGVDCRYWE
ncbi:MAG: hypothetical protein U5L45_22040 [Saprospiraceae bacterium]|nr:hypothetical protein [Saprospiraceae bacterium]